MICPKCGNQLKRDANFCGMCGHSVALPSWSGEDRPPAPAGGRIKVLTAAVVIGIVGSSGAAYFHFRGDEHVRAKAAHPPPGAPLQVTASQPAAATAQPRPPRRLEDGEMRLLSAELRDRQSDPSDCAAARQLLERDYGVVREQSEEMAAATYPMLCPKKPPPAVVAKAPAPPREARAQAPVVKVHEPEKKAHPGQAKAAPKEAPARTKAEKPVLAKAEKPALAAPRPQAAKAVHAKAPALRPAPHPPAMTRVADGQGHDLPRAAALAPLTVDQKYQQRVRAECKPGIFGFICRESLKVEYCRGLWSDRIRPGQTICQRSAGFNNASPMYGGG